MRVLVACEFSGRVRDAFRRLGHDAWSCDILPSESPYHIRTDVCTILEQDWDLMIAHPPCTYLTVTGNRHYANSPLRDEAVDFVLRLMNAPINKIAVENPVGVLSTKIRKPDQIIQPYQFGDPVKKKTCLWLKGLPKLVPTNVVEPEEDVVFRSGNRMGKWYYETSLLPQKERAAARSITFQGIADAMADQWS